MSSDETQDKKPTVEASAQGMSALTDSLKQGIAEYLQTESVQPAAGGELKVDAHFLREHAGPLATFLLKRAATKLLPRDLSFTVPAAKPADAAESEPSSATPAEGAQPVQVSFDLGDFLSRLLNPPSINPPR